MNSIKKIIATIVIFCLMFTSLPMLTGGLVSSAATKTKKIQLSVALNASNKPFLKWNKVSKPLNGYAVFKNGKVLARYGKGTVSFTDDSVPEGQTNTYQIKTYKTKKKTKKTTQWYNKQKKQWQNTKPAKQFRGKKKTVKKKTYSYSYKNASNTVSIATEKTNKEAITPQPTKPNHNHSWGNWVVVTEPTPTSTGTKERTCDTCGAKQRETIPKTEYSYEIHLINEPYGNGGRIAVYVKTNNPNFYDYDLEIMNANNQYDNINIQQSYRAGKTCPYADVDISNLKGAIYICAPKCTGNCKFVVTKYNDATGHMDILASKQVTIKDYNTEETAWMNSVINQVVTPEMTTNSEKMWAICDHLLRTFTYTTNDGEQYITLLSEVGKPYWIQKKTNSSSSPAELVKFGALINYPLKNMYDAYEEGTPYWNQYHMYARSVEDGIDYWYCPGFDTGTIDPSTIQTFNPETFQFWGE